MKARWIRFGEIEVEGERYTDDVVIDGGRVTKRVKKPSKRYRDRYGHTPLSAKESIPWGGKRLIIGTGESGSLPIMPDVWAEAERRGVDDRRGADRGGAAPAREDRREARSRRPPYHVLADGAARQEGVDAGGDRLVEMVGPHELDDAVALQVSVE